MFLKSRSYVKSIFVFLVVCCLGILSNFYPTLFSGFLNMQADPGDTRFNNYVLEHSFQVVFNQNYGGELWSPPFFYPIKNVLAFSDNLFGTSPIYWLFRFFSSPNLAFQLWMIAVSSFCFVSFALLMRHYRVNNILSAFSASLFSFGMPRVAQLGHQQLLPQFFTAFAFWFVWDFIRKPSNKRFILALIFTYLQLLSGVYLGWLLLFSLLITCVVAWAFDPRIKSRLFEYVKSNYIAFASSTVLWFTLVAMLFAPYLKAKQILGGRSYLEVLGILPKFGSWLRPAPGTLWSSLLTSNAEDFLPWPGEHYLFLGFCVIFLTCFSLYTLVKRKVLLSAERELLVKTCLLVSITLFVLSLRIGDFSLWYIVYKVIPGASAIRAVTRISLVIYFYLLIAITLCFDSFIKTEIKSYRWQTLLASIVCVLGLSEQVSFALPSYEKASLAKTRWEMQEVIQKGCDVAYLPKTATGFDFLSSQLLMMEAGMQANIPVINGYSGWIPPDYAAVLNNTRGAEIARNLPHVMNLLGSDFQGRLCILFPYTFTQEASALDSLPAAKHTSSDSNYAAYALQVTPETRSQIISLAASQTLPLPQPIFAQAISLADNQPIELKVGSSLNLSVVVNNTSNFIWSSQAINPVNFAYHWLGLDGTIVLWDGERTPLPSDLPPQSSVTLNARIKPPSKPGQYLLRLSMVQEGVTWFEDQGAKPHDVSITVTSE